MSSPVRVLIVDVEPQSLKLLRAALTHEGYRIFEARAAAEALHAARARKPDVVLLELDLPDADGTDLIKELREQWSHRPILVVSARDGEDEKVRALDRGADDYITKPFGTGELMARIRVALRHEASAGVAGALGGRAVIRIGDWTLDLDRRLVFVGRRQVHLTPQEYDLLTYLMKHAGKVITHPQLLKVVWGPTHTDQRTYLRVYMAQLRRKLEADPAHPRYLLTEPGVGYRLTDSTDDRRGDRSDARAKVSVRSSRATHRAARSRAAQ
jgi:two-component system KDP operon response regulator KdpE